MRKIIVLIAIVFSVKISFCQSTEKSLKLVDFITTDSSFINNPNFPATFRTSYTVPVGKIWKIENIIFNGSLQALIRNVTIIRSGSNLTSPIYYNYNPSIPIWLKGGEQITFIGDYGGSVSFRFSAFEFVIE
jgi:hypothetical protein